MRIRTTWTTMTGALGFAAFALAAGVAAQASGQETFRLVAIAGQPLPVTIEEEDGCREEIVAATLTLEPGGEWTLLTSERELCAGRSEADDDRESGTYTADGQTLRFLDDDGEAATPDDDPDELDVDDLVVGTRSGVTLVVRLADGRTDLEFRQ